MRREYRSAAAKEIAIHYDRTSSVRQVAKVDAAKDLSHLGKAALPCPALDLAYYWLRPNHSRSNSCRCVGAAAGRLSFGSSPCSTLQPLHSRKA